MITHIHTIIHTYTQGATWLNGHAAAAGLRELREAQAAAATEATTNMRDLREAEPPALVLHGSRDPLQAEHPQSNGVMCD